MYPDIPKFECSYVPDGTETLYVMDDPGGGAEADSTYTVPAAGVTCVSELLSLAAAQFALDIGGTWAWSIDWATQRAVLTWDTGHTINLTLSDNINTYVGQADIGGGVQVTPLTAASAPDSIWYPSLSLVSEHPTAMSVHQMTWHVIDSVRTIDGAEIPDRWELVTRVDNTADDWAEYAQLYDFVVNHAADGDYFAWFDAYADAYGDATLCALDERQEVLEFLRVIPGSRRYFDVPLFCTEVTTGMI